MPLPDGQHDGLVRSAIGGVYEVELHPGGTPGTPEGEAAPAGVSGSAGSGPIVEASLRGRLKRQERTGDAVVPGDRVAVSEHEDGSYTIEVVADRHSELARRAPGRGRYRGAKVMVANVDQLVAVFAVAEPAPRLRMVDRFLVLAEANQVDAVVVANKVDLGDDTDASPFRLYEEIGYPVLYTSAESGAGIDELRSSLKGRISALAGPSGVGKSSLLNAVQPGLELRTATVSEAVRKGRKGRHTTVSSRLIPLEAGGYVADTPGLRELGLWGLEPEELDLYFPDFAEARTECRFAASCSHTHEPGCGVRAAVEEGAIHAARYESYVALLSDEEEERAGSEP